MNSIDSCIRSFLINISGAEDPHRGGLITRIGTDIRNLCRMIPMLMICGFLTSAMLFGYIRGYMDSFGVHVEIPSMLLILVCSFAYAVVAHVTLMEIMYPYPKDQYPKDQ